MELTIFNTCIEVESQEQADRLNKICVDNGLIIWNHSKAFQILKLGSRPIFEQGYKIGFGVFYYSFLPLEKELVTEFKWLELLEQHNKTK